MQRNLDARGRAVRLVLGIAMIALSVLLAVTWARASGGGVAWSVCALVFAVGAFCVYEGWAGWCAVRAMGFKTRL